MNNFSYSLVKRLRAVLQNEKIKKYRVYPNETKEIRITNKEEKKSKKKATLSRFNIRNTQYRKKLYNYNCTHILKIKTKRKPS